jgi:hypothetical protein
VIISAFEACGEVDMIAAAPHTAEKHGRNRPSGARLAPVTTERRLPVDA